MNPEPNDVTKDEREGSALLGVVLTLLMVFAYFSFIALGAFAPDVLAQPVSVGGVTTMAFVYGLLVIALGVVLTTFYVWFANRQSI